MMRILLCIKRRSRINHLAETFTRARRGKTTVATRSILVKTEIRIMSAAHSPEWSQCVRSPFLRDQLKAARRATRLLSCLLEDDKLNTILPTNIGEQGSAAG